MAVPSFVEMVAQAVADMERLERERRQVRDDLLAKIAAGNLEDREVAEIYWRFEVVPVAALGDEKDVRLKAREHPWWSWRCRGCGAEVFVQSRNDLRQREQRIREQERLAARGIPRSDDSLAWMCAECRAARQAVGEAAYRRRMMAMQQREQALRTMPYAEYLRTPEWRETRMAALKRAGFACQVCNTGDHLHVHHRTYERRGVELARDLIVLCGPCHALYHGRGLLPAHRGSQEDEEISVAEQLQGPAAAAWVARVVRDTGDGPTWKELGAAMNIPMGYSAFINALIDRGWLAWQKGTSRSLRPGPRSTAAADPGRVA